MLIIVDYNQCTMCTTLNEKSRKSCKKCRCRKYLEPCLSPGWKPKRFGGYYFFSGKPRDINMIPEFELAYYNNSYHKGWCLFRHEEFTPYCNSELKQSDYLAAQNWALRILDEVYGI